MVPNALFYQLLVVALILICLFIHVGLPDKSLPMPQPSLASKRRCTCSKELTPFPGLICKPLCEACEQGADTRPKAPCLPPPFIHFTRGRRCTINTHIHFCPDPDCAYHGWLGRGNIRANGHPGGHLGASCSVSRARATSLRRTAPSFMASTPRPTSSCASSRVSPRGWVSKVAQFLAVCSTVNSQSCAENLRSDASPPPCSEGKRSHGDGGASSPPLQRRTVSSLSPGVALAIGPCQAPDVRATTSVPGVSSTTSPDGNATAGKSRPASAPAMPSRARSWTAASVR
jgi:hypothetical protein